MCTLFWHMACRILQGLNKKSTKNINAAGPLAPAAFPSIAALSPMPNEVCRTPYVCDFSLLLASGGHQILDNLVFFCSIHVCSAAYQI